ncbi:MAG: cell envelope integrity protein TolA [Myxococcales bacterium]|nr:cell envelope integrity protein TolA [Myxococcales bacterium]
MTQLVPSSGRHRHAGRMTAVMRAVRPRATETRLRVALVERGRVLQEALVPRGENVVIGAGEGATLWLSGIAPRKLFVATSHGWRLVLAPGDQGRLATSEGSSSLTSHELAADARGKVVVGDSILLFQVVEALPPPTPMALPRSMVDGLAIDWTTTVVAAFSFLLHFFAVTLVYSDWADPTIDDDYATASLVESTRSFPAPPLLERPRVAEETEASPKASAAPDAGATSARSGRGNGRAGGPTAPPSKEGNADARAAAIASELAAMDIETLQALGSGRATQAVFGDSEVPTALLDDAAASSRGAREAEPSGLVGLEGRGSEQLPQSDGQRRLSDLEGGTERRADAIAAGSSQAVQGPTGSAQIAGTGQSGGAIANASAVVGRMRGRFRACYQQGLAIDPEMQGSAQLVAKVGTNGEVLSVSGGGAGLGPIMGCLRAVVQSGAFAPPEGGSGLVSISVIFRSK